MVQSMGRVVLKQPSLNIVAGIAATGRDCADGAAEAVLAVPSVVINAKTAAATNRVRVLIRSLDPGDRTVRVERAVTEPQQVAEDAVAVGSDQKTGVIGRQHRCVAVVEPGWRERERLCQLTRENAYRLRIACRAVPDLDRRTAHPQMI